jgi:hypothetical protein
MSLNRNVYFQMLDYLFIVINCLSHYSQLFKIRNIVWFDGKDMSVCLSVAEQLPCLLKCIKWLLA